MSDIADYIALVPSQNQNAPRFIATLTAFLQGFVDETNALLLMPEEYDIDVAVGVQLDVVGQWVGLSRQLKQPIAGVYFSFGDPTLGFGQGVWKGPFDPTEGIISLPDDTYRLMLYIKIAANNWNGTLEQMQMILQSVFATQPGTLLFVQDNFDMTMTIGLAGVIPSQLFLELLLQDYITLRPAAVGIKEIIIPSVSGNPLFGFGVQNDYISGFGTGVWGKALT